MKVAKNLFEDVKRIYDEMLTDEERLQFIIGDVKPFYRDSAVNLIDYLSLRSRNIEPLQVELHRHGLSSLASSEGHIKSQVLQVMKWLGNTPEDSAINADRGFELLQRNITGLLGKPDTDQIIPVMVTFDSNFAGDEELLRQLLKNGMRVARINCAHDDRQTWAAMISTLEHVQSDTSLPCKLYMDLAGPKIRTQIVRGKHQHGKSGKIKVREGEELILTDGHHSYKKSQKVIRCTLPGIIENVRPDERIFFDDGLFEAVVTEKLTVNDVLLRITRIATNKPVIKSDKGINFPDSRLSVDPLTKYDRECLPFIVQHADMVGFSFVSSASDMKELQKSLALLGRPDFPIVAKIETRQAVEHLPEIILQGFKQGPIGVMVARGDMAIEIGFERMSEIQDEILWICEAAHVPVIWATQVLETLHKQGIATRGEITDAAHAAQADCVMINKGDYTLEVLQTLRDILKRSRKNNFKNRRLFRKLSIASEFIGNHENIVATGT